MVLPQPEVRLPYLKEGLPVGQKVPEVIHVREAVQDRAVVDLLRVEVVHQEAVHPEKAPPEAALAVAEDNRIRLKPVYCKIRKA